jgi:hypothetical protein
VKAEANAITLCLDRLERHAAIRVETGCHRHDRRR